MMHIRHLGRGWQALSLSLQLYGEDCRHTSTTSKVCLGWSPGPQQ